MLEQEITLLREEITLLREALQAFTKTLNQPTPEELKAEELKAEELKGPVMDDLQEMCMQIVRADRSKKDAVKATIAKYGAETLVGVAAADYPALFADLKALQQ